jgi:hypothetical protein
MTRYSFWDFFKKNINGSLSPKKVFCVNKYILGPGISFERGYTFGGIDFFNYYGMDLKCEKKEGSFHITGFYVKDDR